MSRSWPVMLIGAALVTIAQAGPAVAGEAHSIQTAPSPSTGAPIEGGGSWIVNRPSGYYLGRARPGDTFVDEVTSSANWHYGRALGSVNLCGWVMPGSMGADRGAAADSCSAAGRASVAHRLTVGRDFNAAAHEATDGTAVSADPGCTFYLNYFHSSDFAGNGGHWADAVGHPQGSVRYRFTTRDGGAVVVRDSALGWGFLPTSCVQRPGVLHNDDD